MLLDDIAQILVTAGVATTAPTGIIHAGRLPPHEDRAIGLFEIPGQPGFGVHGAPGMIKYEEPQVEVRVRDQGYVTARTLVQSCWDTFNTTINATVNGTCYLKTRPVQSPFHLLRDENDREVFAFTIQILRAI